MRENNQSSVHTAKSLRQKATKVRQILQYQMIVGFFLIFAVLKSHKKDILKPKTDTFLGLNRDLFR